MKFTINSKTLEGNLFLLNKQVMNKCDNKLLTCVCFTLNEKGRLKQIALNEDGSSVVIGTAVDDHSGSGSFCVQPVIMSNAIKGLPTQGITIEYEKSSLVLSYEGGKVELPCLSGEEFPEVESPVKENAIVNLVNGQSLCDGIKRCIHACATDELRLKLTAVYFEMNEDNFQIVALDGKRAVISKYKQKDGKQTCILLPKRVARLVKDINATEVKITTYPDNNKFDLLFDKYLRVNGVGIAEKYPNYKKMIKCEGGSKMMVNRTSLINTLNRMAFFCDESAKTRIEVAKTGITISGADDEKGCGMKESLSCAYEGEDKFIGINCNYLGEILKNLSEKNIELKIVDEKNPLFIKQDGTDYKVFAFVSYMVLEDKASLDDEDAEEQTEEDAEEQTEENAEEQTEENAEELTEENPDEDNAE